MLKPVSCALAVGLLGLSILLTPAAAETRIAPQPSGISPLRISNAWIEAKPVIANQQLYTLNWVPGLSAALARGRRERRPVLALVIRNISGGGNIYSGHC